MLTLNDYKHKALIFVISADHKMRFANNNLVIEDKETGKITNQMPCSKIFGVFVIGSITLTSNIIEKAGYHGFSLIFMKNNFRPYSYMGALTEGNTLLRQKQYERMPDKELAKYLVHNKVSNQLALLQELRQKTNQTEVAIKKLENILTEINNDGRGDNALLLGREGNASKIYFKAYFNNYEWTARRPRVKHDAINTLMDIGYTFLFNFVEAHMRLYGFDVYVGFYHRLFYQRKSLICDLVEPFRVIVDKTIRKGFNLRQFKDSDFNIFKNQYILKIDKNKDYTRIFFEDILKHKEEIFLYVRDFYRAFMKDKPVENYPRFLIYGEEVDKDHDHNKL